MANKLNGFLDNFFSGALNPKGTVGDFAHAQRLYVDDAFRLAPKVKFLHFINFNINPEALALFPLLSQRHRNEINMLCKRMDLPQYTASTDTKNQYNRKKNIQTRMDYTPVSITMHDDNLGLTTMLMEAYYRYYNRDGNISDITASFDPRSTYKEANGRTYRFGLDNDKRVPFFRDIKLYQFSRHEYTEFTLINPMIQQWGHDSMDQTDGTGTAENRMTVQYEAVLYDRGQVGEDNPAGFGQAHYDQTPSPLSIAGGGIASLFGGGGVLDGASSVLGDITSGNVGLGTIFNAVNTVRNAKNLTLSSVLNEGVGMAVGALQNAAKEPGGLASIAVPTETGIPATTPTSAAITPSYDDAVLRQQRAAKVAQAQAANDVGP